MFHFGNQQISRCDGSITLQPEMLICWIRSRRIEWTWWYHLIKHTFSRRYHAWNRFTKTKGVGPLITSQNKERPSSIGWIARPQLINRSFSRRGATGAAGRREINIVDSAAASTNSQKCVVSRINKQDDRLTPRDRQRYSTQYSLWCSSSTINLAPLHLLYSTRM